MMHLLEKSIYPLNMESGANCSGLPTPGILVPILHIKSKKNAGLYPPEMFQCLSRSDAANFHLNIMIEVWWFQK